MIQKPQNMVVILLVSNVLRVGTNANSNFNLNYNATVTQKLDLLKNIQSTYPH